MSLYVELQEMEYNEELRGKYTVLAYGNQGGRWFFIVNVGGQWPTAYVEAKESDPEWISDCDYEGFTPHGGITFARKNLSHLKRSLEGFGVPDEILCRNYWGWDYGHINDYCVWLGDNMADDFGEPYRKWTKKEIYEEDVEPFIEWISTYFPDTKESKK